MSPESVELSQVVKLDRNADHEFLGQLKISAGSANRQMRGGDHATAPVS
jgi:hypothetical protein